jgi:hypothetical protein
VPTRPGHYGEFYRLLAEALNGHGSLPVNPDDSVAVLEVVEAARRSATERSVIGVA